LPSFFAASALAVVLRRVGRKEEAASYVLAAGARYNALLARYPDAFADPAAAFWLENGDARPALALAERNFALRQTDRAYGLLERTAMAIGKQGVDDHTPHRDHEDAMAKLHRHS
jgi:hypothetical protein